MKKARAWLDQRGIVHTFHDYKSAGADEDSLRAWAAEHRWDKLLNRAGTTFRKLPEAQKQGLTAETAIALMAAQPSMIKRPVLDLGDRRIVGFRADEYDAAFGAPPGTD